MPSGRVAVIDIGSNSIKVLVAARDSTGVVATLHQRTIDARISAGISEASPVLTGEGMDRGLAAIRSLLADILPHSPERAILVATSAVRDAGNAGDFLARVRAATGHAIRILTGEEEANLIGRGLACDPALVGLRHFYVFDLGGGSLECLAFRDRRVEQALSLQLGCVRLTEKLVRDPAQPISAAVLHQVAAETHAILAHSDFKFALPPGSVAVGTGGTITAARAILGARDGTALDHTDPVVTVAQLRDLLSWLGALPLADRRQIPGLPPPRADVFPTALATLVAVADAGGFPAFQNSLYNLRYGLAAEALQ